MKHKFPFDCVGKGLLNVNVCLLIVGVSSLYVICPLPYPSPVVVLPLFEVVCMIHERYSFKYVLHLLYFLGFLILIV